MSQSAYELVWLVSKDDILNNQALVEQFFDLYVNEDNFPDENERENPEVIKQRILDHSAKPHTHLIAYCLNRAVKGGAIVEYYPQSACCLLTYIFVDKESRGMGIARTLIESDEEKGIPGLVRAIRSGGKEVHAVLFESNNPFLTEEGSDSMAPADRLKTFYKLGAKRVDIAYVQPSLDSEKDPVSNLYLCTFPKLNGEAFLLPIQVLLRFLVEFYDSLEGLTGDFEEEFKKANDWQPGQAPGFNTEALNQMYESLIRNEYAQYGISYLKQIPLIEEPRLSFERASVCCEILVDETYYQPTVYKSKTERFERLSEGATNIDPMSTHNQNDKYCVVTHSFETDLFAYAYQEAPPFYTRIYNFPAFKEVIVRFPQTFSFTSEGRQEMMYVLDDGKNGRAGKVKTITRRLADGTLLEEIVKEVRMKVFLNYSYFLNSEIRVWHLIFTSFEGNGIDEIDLIKLMKFFSGSQESRTEAEKNKELEKIKFVNSEKQEEEEYTIIELFHKLSGVKYKKRADYQFDQNVSDNISIRDIKNGIVEIDTDYCQFPQATSPEAEQATKEVLVQLFENLKTNEEGKKVSSADVQRQYAQNREAEYVFEAFCGITLGIFDYARMGFEEVSDTLVPRSATEVSFLTINRGVLSSFGYGDSVLSSAIKTIGINPYLLVPSAVLAHNEYVSNDAFNRSLTVLEELRQDETQVDITNLERCRKQVRNLLNIDFLPNVFQYPTEQDLYAYGLIHRGILEKNKRTQANLEQIDDVIEESNASLNHRYQFWVNILLMVISLFQIYEVVTKLIIGVGGEGMNTSPVIMQIIVLILLIIGCVYISYRLYKNASFDTTKRFILKK